MKKASLILIFVIAFNFCKNAGNNEQVIGRFDISKDDSVILFSCYKINESSIYTLCKGITKKIISSTDKINFYYPRYSKDNSKIVFIGYEKGSATKSALYIAKSDGSEVTKLIDDDAMLTQAFFSDFGEKVIFTKANSYGKSSPIGTEQAHGFDIYSYEIATKKIEKITNLNSYGIYQVSELDSNTFMMQIAGGEDGGIYLYSNTSEKKLKRIVPKNNPRQKDLYYDPLFSKKYNLLAFTAPYEVYVMDPKGQIAERILDNRGIADIDGICFYNTQKKLLLYFSGRLISVDIDTHQAVDIPFNL